MTIFELSHSLSSLNPLMRFHNLEHRVSTFRSRFTVSRSEETWLTLVLEDTWLALVKASWPLLPPTSVHNVDQCNNRSQRKVG